MGRRCSVSTTVFDAKAIELLMADTFYEGRTPRSEQYRQGVRSILVHRLQSTPIVATPYRVGTCAADAYFAGQSEGHAIARRLIGGEL